MTKKKVKDFPDLEKHTSNGAVINTNDSLYQKRLNEIKALEQQKIKDDQFDSEFNALKDDVNEIKTLLKTLLASNE